MPEGNDDLIHARMLAAEINLIIAHSSLVSMRDEVECLEKVIAILQKAVDELEVLECLE